MYLLAGVGICIIVCSSLIKTSRRCSLFERRLETERLFTTAGPANRDHTLAGPTKHHSWSMQTFLCMHELLSFYSNILSTWISDQEMQEALYDGIS